MPIMLWLQLNTHHQSAEASTRDTDDRAFTDYKAQNRADLWSGMCAEWRRDLKTGPLKEHLPKISQLELREAINMLSNMNDATSHQRLIVRAFHAAGNEQQAHGVLRPPDDSPLSCAPLGPCGAALGWTHAHTQSLLFSVGMIHLNECNMSPAMLTAPLQA